MPSSIRPPDRVGGRPLGTAHHGGMTSLEALWNGWVHGRRVWRGEMADPRCGRTAGSPAGLTKPMEAARQFPNTTWAGYSSCSHV